MIQMAPSEFAVSLGISDRAARDAFSKAVDGKPWRGHYLPVIREAGQRGGAGGQVWALDTAAASPELRALLKLPEPAPSTPVEPRLKGRPRERDFAAGEAKMRIIAPALEHPRGSAERAAAVKAAAGVPHLFGGELRRVAERTIYDWICHVETRGGAAVVPVPRADAGTYRELITRRWRKDCGLAADVQERIAAQLERIARGLILKGRSDREVARLAGIELQRLTAAAGVIRPKSEADKLCKLNVRWVQRFREMKPARDHMNDHKRFSDKHEYRVSRHLTAEPMEVLYGDVHKVDLKVADAIASDWASLRSAAKVATGKGLMTIRVAIIGWMDGSSHYLWATPVILGPGQGITQQDVARSLFDVLTCPWGGIPRQIVIDNGSEYKALGEAVMRFCAMSELAGFGVVHSRPYSPEGKGRLEGAFGILERRFLSALPGYIAGDRMNSPTKSKGKPVDPYPHGAARLVADIGRAVEQLNGTAQQGQLAGLSPKAMLEAKARQTGWQAQCPDADTFDVVFSREEYRNVRQGAFSINGKNYSAPILAEMIGEERVQVLVPMRDPDGPAFLIRDRVVHRLEVDSFALNDTEGARHKGRMVKDQKAEIARRKGKADLSVDVPELLSRAADLGPVAHNPPAGWKMQTLDKAGALTAPRTAEEAEALHDAEIRRRADEYLAMRGKALPGRAGDQRLQPQATQHATPI